MPEPRRARETAPVAVSWAYEAGMPPPEGKTRNPRKGKPVARRNGLPPFRPYQYRGTGRDTLTGHLSETQIRRAARARA